MQMVFDVRAYERQEIASILKIKTDSHNFTRDVRNKLTIMGYEFLLPRGGPVIITKQPDTPEAKLREIMFHRFGLDTQIGTNGEMENGTKCFACFLYFMMTEPAAQTMPWNERYHLINDWYGVNIVYPTLERWTRRLLDNEIMHQSQGRQDAQWWTTFFIDGKKYQEPVEDNDIGQIHEYWKTHGEVLSQMLAEYKGDSKSAWTATNKLMWKKYGCCYYRCKCLMVNGITVTEISEIIDLVEAIIAETY